MQSGNPDLTIKWYAMRDLSRTHAKHPAYKLLADQAFEVFTPMTNKLVIEKGKRTRRTTPFVPDLLFVHSCRHQLDNAVRKIENLQYRYVHGAFCEPMTVRESDMNRFILAIKNSHKPIYYTPDEITPDMCGKRVRIVGGELDGYVGHLAKMSGSKYKRLMVSIPNFLTATVEVSPEFIESLEE